MLTRDEVGELRRYVRALDVLAQRSLAARRDRPAAPELMRETFLQGEAARLESYYSACERIFERVTVGLNGGLPEGKDWHETLLRRMSLNVPGARPAVLSEQTWEWLDDLRRFRHARRHLYDTMIKENRLDEHLDHLASGHGILATELNCFLDVMEEVLRKAGD